MMNNILSICVCLSIFIPAMVNGLTCYDCTICNDPFSATNKSTSTSNSSSQSCYKIVVAGVATRGIMSGCVQSNILSVGTWCCTTDLCNSAQSMVPRNIAVLVWTLAVSMSTFMMFRLKQ